MIGWFALTFVDQFLEAKYSWPAAGLALVCFLVTRIIMMQMYSWPQMILIK